MGQPSLKPVLKPSDREFNYLPIKELNVGIFEIFYPQLLMKSKIWINLDCMFLHEMDPYATVGAVLQVS